jgi:uncharacterized membrane protein
VKKMAPSLTVVLASFLLAFKAVLVEGSEVALIAVATVSRLGKKNVLLGIVLGALGSLVLLLAVREVFTLLPDILIDFGTAIILLYFSRKFWKGFLKYYRSRGLFEAKLKKIEDEVVQKGLERSKGSTAEGTIPFSFANSVPVLFITLTEGFEASLVLAAAGAFSPEWTAIGGLLSLALLVIVSVLAYDKLLRVPHWLLDLIAGIVLLSFGTYFAMSGVLAALGAWS